MQDRLRARDEYANVSENNDVSGLLKLIKVVVHQFEIHVCLDESLWQAKYKVLTYNHGDFDTNAIHIRNIKNLLEVVEHFGGGIFDNEILAAKAKERDKERGLPALSKKEYAEVAKDGQSQSMPCEPANTKA